MNIAIATKAVHPCISLVTGIRHVDAYPQFYKELFSAYLDEVDAEFKIRAQNWEKRGTIETNIQTLFCAFSTR